MIIRWDENPLRTRVELDDSDRARLRLAVHVELLRRRIYATYFELEREGGSKKYAMGTLNIGGLEAAPLKETLDELQAEYEAALQDEHYGDCVCQAVSCEKCHAESLLEIDTIGGLGNHDGHQIQKHFTGTLIEAIDHNAAVWLRKYRDEHFPDKGADNACQ